MTINEELLSLVEIRFNQYYVGKQKNIDLENAKKDTMYAFNTTNCLYDESFQKASDFYFENMNTDSYEECLSIINKALEICPHFYPAKYMTIINNNDNNKQILELEELREELKHKYDSIGFLIDSSPSIYGARFADTYHMILSRLIFINIDLNQFNKARVYAEMLCRLDKYNLCDSLYDYVYTLILNEKYELALKLMSRTNLPQYTFLKYFICMFQNKNDEAFKLFKLLVAQNPYYGLITTGIIDDFESYYDLFDDYEWMYYEPPLDQSLQIAMINTIRINYLIRKATDTSYFKNYSNKQLEYFIDLPEIEKFIIGRISFENYTKINLYNEAVNNEGFDIDMNEFNSHINILERKGYIAKDKKKYTSTPLTLYLTKFIINLAEKFKEAE